ncbi:RNA-binding protein [Theileria orientalis]|uniref:RNA-binding protein n=1 Tax=Theileria orientalis TaxID=68886 RepID=A0A976QSJ2_THEOR|nr:RNA-binding protein [Theileria orientalis]
MTDSSTSSVNAKLFVGSVPTNVTEEQLKSELSKYGQLVSLFYMPDQTKQNNGWAFVTFETNENASDAIDALNGKVVFDGSSQGLEVVYASQRNMAETQPQPPKPQPSSSPLWQQFTTAEGVPYYYNVRTGQTQWQKPVEFTSTSAPRTAGGGSSFGPPGANLFVFHVPASWNDIDLIEHFKHFGNVISARVQRDSAGRNRGFGFISYDNPQSAVVAIKNMNGFSVGGKYLKVQLKKGEEHYMHSDQYQVQPYSSQGQYGSTHVQSSSSTLTPKYQMHYNPY